MPDCPFCQRIAAGEYDYDGLGSVAFQPLNPVTPGHFLVVQRRHVADAREVPRLTGYAAQFAAALAAEMGLESFNLITSVGEAATQSVRHLHWHVVPRRPGDGLPLPWTPQQDQQAVAAALQSFAGDLDSVGMTYSAELAREAARAPGARL